MTSSCIKVSGELDLSLFGTGCAFVPVVGQLQVSGTWTANADGTYLDNTVTTGDQQITLAKSCLVISSVPVTCDGAANLLINLGYSSFNCTPASSGGCDCSATVEQKGGLASVSASPLTGGSFTTSGNLITIMGDASDSKDAYCVANDR
ncbi:MAG TPA: hypothetical protein VER04_22780, partial [Polyangiaceae bacterium]|nr:hypothetical protein [Polyangiaceae bacterium]